MSKMKSNTYLVNTTFIAYFDVDEIGIEVPNEPDGVSDKYQIKFQYVSEDTNRGTVSGRVTEVKTVYEIVTGEDGNDHRELRPASPDANVTVSSLGSYLFNNWTDGSRGYATRMKLELPEFTQSTTFTAQFRFNGGGRYWSWRWRRSQRQHRRQRTLQPINRRPGYHNHHPRRRAVSTSSGITSRCNLN